MIEHSIYHRWFHISVMFEPFDTLKKLLRNDISFVEDLTKNRLSTAEGFFLHSSIDWNKSPLSRQQASRSGRMRHLLFRWSYQKYRVHRIQITATEGASKPYANCL